LTIHAAFISTTQENAPFTKVLFYEHCPNMSMHKRPLFSPREIILGKALQRFSRDTRQNVEKNIGN